LTTSWPDTTSTSAPTIAERPYFLSPPKGKAGRKGTITILATIYSKNCIQAFISSSRSTSRKSRAAPSGRVGKPTKMKYKKEIKM
jgi:hypothetical protein